LQIRRISLVKGKFMVTEVIPTVSGEKHFKDFFIFSSVKDWSKRSRILISWPSFNNTAAMELSPVVRDGYSLKG
jgi:hypothetical protein